MTYTFVICDDEPAALMSITELAQQWANTKGHIATIHCFPSAEAFLFHYEEDKAVDILLLDIEMQGMNGVTLAHQIRAANKEVQIVFVTGYMEYISDGYEVEALHYLIKPATAEKLNSVLDRAAEKLQQSSRCLLLHTPQESIRVPLYEIHYMEVQRNYVTVHARGAYTIKTTLNEMEHRLDNGFLRVGRSVIVNLRSIRRVTQAEIWLVNGSCIPLPRGAYEIVNRAMIERL